MKVKIIAPFEIPGRQADGSLELAEGARVRDLLRSAPLYAAILPVSVNGQQAPRSRKLKDGDLVVVIAPIQGG